MPNLATIATTPVGHSEYADTLRSAWERDPYIAAMLTDYRDAGEIPIGAQAYELIGAPGGYVIDSEGHLGGFFTTVRGTGSALALDAIRHGARTLDCFDGYLVDFWTRHGFTETRREPNWTAGGPDVVWMKLACPELPCHLGTVHLAGDHA